ncbi:phosphonate metabolism protein/1,5-bisphosphokinase (PRPP-forming) PhnN [Variovorax sp. YR752]|uniref:phosphonate metabolism protein/1,5-bisphosphokinase (PRPP-forming) PhnN n=1 Tax=Variovorax sp. YR752 TaxID=1884383 RepID=UPI003137ED08
MSGIVACSHRLLIVVGPSGAGKDSLISAWLGSLPAAIRPQRARRTITRPADAHEDHEWIDAAAFARDRDAGAFAFWWTAHGLAYGIRQRELAPLASGRWVVMNGSREHLATLREAAPHARVVTVDAPAELRRQRLRSRGREDAPAQGARLQRAAPAVDADLHIDNCGTLADAVAQLHAWWQPLAAGAGERLSRPSSAAPA